MGSGASSRRATFATPVYKAYEGVDELKEKCRHLVVVNDGSLNRDSGNSRTPSLDFSVSDSSPVTDDSTSRGETDSLLSTPRDLKRPKRVRFANVVTVSGGRRGSVETAELATPDEERHLTSWDDGILERDVVRIDLENGQTKSIRYDPRSSAVSEIIELLKTKLKFSTGQFLALSLVKGLMDGGQPVIRVLGADDNVHQKVALKLRKEEDLRCFLRVVFVPGDLNELLAQDPEAYNYLYTQCCNDVIQERFAGELKCNEVLDLGALQVVQWAYEERIQRNKIIRNIESSWELNPFVPKSLLRTMAERQIRRRITRLVKVHLQSFVNSFEAKREYLRRIEQLPSFARRQFQLENCEKIFVGPNTGIQTVQGSEVFSFAKFTQLASLTVDSRLQSISPNERTKVILELTENQTDNQTLRREVFLLTEDVDDFVAWISGYYSIYANRKLSIRTLDDFQYDFNGSYTEYPDFTVGDSLPLVSSVYDQRHRVIGEDFYSGRQVSRGHFCQPTCGYCPALENVINQLETALPPQDDEIDPVQPTFNLNHHQSSGSSEDEGLGETSGTTDSWMLPLSRKEQPCSAGYLGNVGNYREVNYRRDIADVNCCNGYGYHSSDVDVTGDGCLGYQSASRGGSWNKDTMAEDEETISCHLRRFFDDGESETFAPARVESPAFFLDNIPEPQLEDSDFQLFIISEGISLILSPPVGFNDQTFPEGSHSTGSSDAILLPTFSQEERSTDHLMVPSNLENSSAENAVRLPSPIPPPSYSPSFSALIPPPQSFAPLTPSFISQIPRSVSPPQIRKPVVEAPLPPCLPQPLAFSSIPLTSSLPLPPPLPFLSLPFLPLPEPSLQLVGIPPFPSQPQSFPSLTPTSSSPVPPPFPSLPPSFSPTPEPLRSLLLPPPVEFETPTDINKDWLTTDVLDEMLNKTLIQSDDQGPRQNGVKLLQDGKTFPGLDRL